MKIKQFLGPILTTVLVNVYYIAFVFFCVAFDGVPGIVKIILGVVPLVLSFVASGYFAKKAEEDKKNGKFQTKKKKK